MSSNLNSIPTGNIVSNIETQIHPEEDKEDLVGGCYGVIESDPGSNSYYHCQCAFY
jgi:hypothetical protein